MSEYSEHIVLMQVYTTEWLKDVLRIKSGKNSNDTLKKDMLKYLATNLFVLVDPDRDYAEKFFGPKTGERTELYFKLMDLWTIVNNQVDPELTKKYTDNFIGSFPGIDKTKVQKVIVDYPFLLLFPSLRKEGLLRLMV